MKLVKTFMAGLTFPATVLPFIYTALYLCERSSVHQAPLQFMPLFIPIVFGVWNVICITGAKCCPCNNPSIRAFADGAILGIIVSLVGVFVLDLPALLFGWEDNLRYLPLLLVPIIYGLTWRFIVYPLNRMLGVL